MGQGLKPTDPDMLYFIQGFLFKISKMKIQQRRKGNTVSGEVKGTVLVFNPLKSDGASRPPSWWPDPARYKEDYRCV